MDTGPRRAIAWPWSRRQHHGGELERGEEVGMDKVGGGRLTYGAHLDGVQF